MLKNQTPPKECKYCMEEKSVLMIKPVAFHIKGETSINVNKTNKDLWMCLDCLSLELDALGASIDIYSYDD